MQWTATVLTQLLKVKYPIIQAPMAGGPTTPELVAAVCNAGGLGSVGAGYLQPEQLQKDIQTIRTLTKQPFAVNLFVPCSSVESATVQEKMQQQLAPHFAAAGAMVPENVSAPYAPDFDEQFAVVLAEEVPILSFTFGALDAEHIKALKQNKTIIMGTATTIDEALTLQERGVDMIVAQGYEAGGHRGTFLGKEEQSLIGGMALIPQIVDKVTIPVVAAGGIMDGRGVLAALCLGASGVQMGTAFLTCKEAGVAQCYQDAITKAKGEDTVLTRMFSGKLARAIDNTFAQAMVTQTEIPDYPIQNKLTKPMRTAAKEHNNIDYMSLWAGQGAILARKMSAAELITALIAEVETLLRN